MMVNHPGRSKSDPVAAARRIMRKHQIKMLEVRIAHEAVYADAVPEPNHPIVTQRREEAIKALGGSISMKEASGISDRLYEPIARGSGKTIDEAIEHLGAALGRIVAE